MSFKEGRNIERKPSWLKIKLPSGDGYSQVNRVVKEHGLHTICSSGMCPNIAECWGNGTATFMILGDVCTRSCRFCATTTGKPQPPNPDEPNQLAQSIKLMKLRHCVITSVTRDDLPDGGALHWHNTIL
ncbi:MAG: lipoyl synthase, partial [Bacteroidetes bacterium HGW-Bacteroidetes-15]